MARKRRPHPDNSTVELRADAAWNRYASTVTTGGTPEQRQWAFDRYVDALEALVKVEWSAEKQKEKEVPA